MRRSRSLALGFAFFALAAPASAQTPDAPPQVPPAQAAPPQAAPPQAAPPAQAYPQPQAYPQQPYPQQPYPQQPQPGVYGQPQPQAYPPGYTPPPPVYSQPNYPQQAYPPGYGYAPEPPPPPKPESLRWSLRFDPFELVMRQLTFQGEVYVAGPFAIEVSPSWIFGSPYSGIDKKGVSVAANAVFYLSMIGLRGMWLKAHFAYENYAVQLTDEAGGTPDEERLSAILGAMFGDTFVIPRSGGFALSAGIGVGAATAPKKTLTTSNGVTATLYDGFDKVRLLGSLGLGVAF